MRVVVFVTASKRAEAERIAKALIKDKLAACVNIIGDVRSIFWWKGKVDSASETFLMIKSKKELLPEIIKKVKALHSYELPEVIAIPVTGGLKKYLEWIDGSVRNPRRLR